MEEELFDEDEEPEPTQTTSEQIKGIEGAVNPSLEGPSDSKSEKSDSTLISKATEAEEGSRPQKRTSPSLLTKVSRIKTHKRLRVALAGYSVVALFTLSYLIANQIQNRVGGSALSQPAALVFAILIAAPLALAFVWERLRGVKVFDVELNFEEVKTTLSITLSNEIKESTMQFGTTKMPEILEKIKAAIRQEKTAELVEVNLGDGTMWWSTRIYLLAALAEDYTNIRQLVFLENCELQEKCFIGIATPKATRRALAIQLPDFEKAYRVASQQSLDVSVGQTITPEDRAERVVNGLVWLPPEKKPEGVEILENVGGEYGLKQLVTGQLLRQWLDQDLIKEIVECKDGECDDCVLKPLLLYRIIERRAPFVALIQNLQLKYMVDRLKIAALVANTILRQQLQ